MTYPVGTPVTTVLLDTTDEDNKGEVFAVTYLYPDGEVRTVQRGGMGNVFSHLDMAREVSNYAEDGIRCLSVIEGEFCYLTGAHSVFVQ